MANGSRCRVLVFVPTYNDAQELAAIANDVQSLDGEYTTLVVDDGSTTPVDHGELPKGTLLVRFPTNFGLGVATHVAFDHALQHDYDVLVRVDSDGQHPTKLIPSLVQPISDEGKGLVVGHRVNRHDGTGARALLAAWVRNYLSVLSRLMTGGRAPKDVNSGLFAISAAAMRQLNTAQLERFPEPQMYVLSGRMGISVHEISFEQNERRFGKSTVTLGRAMALFYRFNIFILAELLQSPRSK